MRFSHLLTLALIACSDTTAVAPIEPSSPPSLEPPPVSAEVSCNLQDRQSCLDNTLCTLVHVSGMQYECRVSRGEHQRGLRAAGWPVAAIPDRPLDHAVRQLLTSVSRARSQ